MPSKPHSAGCVRLMDPDTFSKKRKGSKNRNARKKNMRDFKKKMIPARDPVYIQRKEDNAKLLKLGQDIHAHIEQETAMYHREFNQNMSGKKASLMSSYSTYHPFPSDLHSSIVARWKKDIPWLLPKFFKETQVVPIRLSSNATDVATVTGSQMNTVVNIDGSIFNNMTALLGIFEEYRFVKGDFHYRPTTVCLPTAWQNNALCIGVMDYGQSTALGTFSAGLSHDNKRIFPLVLDGSVKPSAKNGEVSWAIKIDAQPDEAWIGNTVTNVATAWWKPFMPSVASPGTGTTGVWWCNMDFEFRGLAP